VNVKVYARPSSVHLLKFERLGLQNVHNAWVADGASCRHRWVSDTRECPRLFKFFGFRQFYSHGLNYFQTRLFKTVLE